ncbi:hypothetical protein CASFOL_021045 [Castilleja foliolosa]|uniref:Uncharacterized protein n=1 Tax=Castilleja foliolosa TaxID=1961234 RepID=A0ABD3CXD9_9LAMI
MDPVMKATNDGGVRGHWWLLVAVSGAMGRRRPECSDGEIERERGVRRRVAADRTYKK